jgi:hypothetical protein
LADLEQQALFLPRSAISENLEEIGHGELLTPNSQCADCHIVLTVDVINLIDCVWFFAC